MNSPKVLPILCLLFALILPSCSSGGYTETSSASPAASSPPVNQAHVHEPEPVPAVPATCEKTGSTESMRCKTCGAYTTPPKTIPRTSHSCEDGICDTCHKLIRFGEPVPETGIWHSGFYKDEFGDITDESVVYTDTIKGTFSNSATNNSSLTVILYAEQSKIYIKLYEYGKHPVSFALYSYDIHIKHGDTKETLYADLFDSAIPLQYNNFTKIKSILLAGEDIQFVIKEDGGTSTYNFTVSASNFCYTYSLTFPLYGVESIANLERERILNNFKTILNDYPKIKSFDASTIMAIYNYVYFELNPTFSGFFGNSKEKGETDERTVLKKAADKFGIYPEQAEISYKFVSDNYDLVASAVGCENSK